MALSPVKVEPEAGPSTPRSAIASRIASYAYTPPKVSQSRSPASVKRRRVVEVVIESPRTRKSRQLTGEQDNDEGLEGHGIEASSSSGKRRIKRSSPVVEIKDEPGTPLRKVGPMDKMKKSPKVPRPYAGPEVYAHLQHLPDHLKPGLSIVFCGINPGKRSATDGHHFAHPSNKFWKALHMAGITDRRVLPSEDADMPDLFDFGLTNLCDRPTMEMSELSDLEMKLQVPHFTRKMLQYKPLVVCLVGKKIWDIYDGVVSRTAGVASTNVPDETPWCDSVTPKSEIPFNPYLDVEAPYVPPNPYLDSPIIQTKAQNGVTLLSLNEPRRPVRDTSTPYPSSPPATPKRTKGKIKAPFDWHAPRMFRLPHENGYTYFWTTPNTSGLERTPLPEVAQMFRDLKAFAERLRSGRAPPGKFRDIDIKGVEASAGFLRREAEARGKVVSYVPGRQGTDEEVKVQ